MASLSFNEYEASNMTHYTRWRYLIAFALSLMGKKGLVILQTLRIGKLSLYNFCPGRYRSSQNSSSGVHPEHQRLHLQWKPCDHRQPCHSLDICCHPTLCFRARLCGAACHQSGERSALNMLHFLLLSSSELLTKPESEL